MIDFPETFFFSSRRRHTRFDCDWSSDVCSSDLHLDVVAGLEAHIPTAVFDVVAHVERRDAGAENRLDVAEGATSATRLRSEERRVGKECRSRWSPYH